MIKKSFLSLSIGLACSLVAGAAFATLTWSTSAGTLSQVETDSVSTTVAANGTLTYLGFSTWPNNRPTCTATVQAQLEGSADSVKAMTTLATAAFLAGKGIRVEWDGCDPTSNLARINAIMLQ